MGEIGPFSKMCRFVIMKGTAAMKIYSGNGLIEHIAIVPRDFRAVGANQNFLEITSTAIKGILEEAGLDFCPPLLLLTPFYEEEGHRCFFIAAQTRRRGLTDFFIRREDLLGMLPVELSEKELVMLYSLQYPDKALDMGAVAAVLAGQSAALEIMAQSEKQ